MARSRQVSPRIISPAGNVVRSLQPYPPDIQVYIDNGLTYQSNNANFITRDTNGNIVFTQQGLDNQNLVIEPITLQYTNQSVVKNIDTRFKYFKFPVENISVPDIDFELPEIADIIDSAGSIDPVFALYAPSSNFRLTSANVITGILMDVVRDGFPQVTANQYVINDVIKESGVDLRFRIKIRHTYVSAGSGSPTGTIFFTIIKRPANSNTPIRDFIVLTQNEDAFISRSQVLTKNYDVIIPNSDFNTNDSFQIGAIVGQYTNNVETHTILETETFWSITDAAKNVNINNQPI